MPRTGLAGMERVRVAIAFLQVSVTAAVAESCNRNIKLKVLSSTAILPQLAWKDRFSDEVNVNHVRYSTEVWNMTAVRDKNSGRRLSGRQRWEP